MQEEKLIDLEDDDNFNWLHRSREVEVKKELDDLITGETDES